MSRIRTIKPDFWSSEQVMNCARNSRLLFIGIWNFCDDAGRCVDSAKTLKAQIFPGDIDVSSENVRGMIDELSANGLLVKYEVDGQAFLQVTGWKHQRIDKPQPPKCPPPNSSNVPRVFPPDPIVSNPKGKDRILGVGVNSVDNRSLASAPPALANGHNTEPWKTKRPSEMNHDDWNAYYAAKKVG